MTSTQPSASLSGGKSINTSSTHSSGQQQAQVTSPSFEASTRRSGSHSNTAPTPRNHQTQKKQHKNGRRPRFADEDAMAESSAIRNPNGRRGQTSITHLMNFTLPPRPQYNQQSMGRGTRRGNIYGIGSGHHASDKARYIHANYRFIVKPNGDYKQQAVNADQHLDWNDVLQILASASSQTSACPICLSPPVAPRMAKCGHIFCLPCLIRYMHSTDDANPLPDKKARWKKCPICWDSVFISDTRPVRWFVGQEGPAPAEGDDVVLRLVMRQPGSTLALPRDGADALRKLEDIPWYFAAEVPDYARVMKGSEEYMFAQFNSEIEELQRQEKEDELMFGEETVWTTKAVNSIKDAKEKIKGIGNPPSLPEQPTERKPKRLPIQFNTKDDEVPDMYLVQHASKSGQSIPNLLPVTVEGPSDSTTTISQGHDEADQLFRPKQPQNDSHGAHRPDEPYFFYQALLHYYLAPLDIRILKSAFGNFASFPATLLPRVERVSTGHIMDDELRKRTKYLAHLPYGCEVGFLECNWTDVVSPEVLTQFKEEIERRRKRNRDKEYREEKERARAEKEEDDKRWASARRNRPDEIVDNFTTDQDFHSMPPLDGNNASPPWPSRQGSSFASLASPSTSPNGPRTVWGTTLVAPASPESHAQHQFENDGDDGWLQSWEQDFANAENELIAKAQAASLGEGSAAPSAPEPKGKKKKAKKITLMSTTVRRHA
ncbi:ring-15 protein [Phlyctema vagabunda]|uniref:Ring-15 protein n=1 Tax=Phlyctema vagabunda TaxID=108571 RepID=A0ABR4PL94_9HELO